MMKDCMQIAPKLATKQALEPCFIVIERENHNPLVGGSNPSAATIIPHANPPQGGSCGDNQAFDSNTNFEFLAGCQAALPWFLGFGSRSSEFFATAVQKWLATIGVKTACITPASPWENGYNESFNGSLRDDLLDGEIFYSLAEAKVLIEAWRRHYNTERPHMALGGLTPKAFADQIDRAQKIA
jgi:hypothetical protein